MAGSSEVREINPQRLQLYVDLLQRGQGIFDLIADRALGDVDQQTFDEWAIREWEAQLANQRAHNASPVLAINEERQAKISIMAAHVRDVVRLQLVNESHMPLIRSEIHTRIKENPDLPFYRSHQPLVAFITHFAPPSGSSTTRRDRR